MFSNNKTITLFYTYESQPKRVRIIINQFSGAIIYEFLALQDNVQHTTNQSVLKKEPRSIEQLYYKHLPKEKELLVVSFFHNASFLTQPCLALPFKIQQFNKQLSIRPYVIIMLRTSFTVTRHSILCLNIKELLARSRRHT